MGRSRAPLIAITAMLGLILASSAVRASSSEESDFVSRINAERVSRGIGALAVRSDLVEVARNWSQQMAAAGQIWHDPNMPNEVSGWTALGDNVGRGPSVYAIHNAFMDSPEHRSIILDSTYDQVGVGVADSGDTIYVTEIFVQRASSTFRARIVHHYSPTPHARTIAQTGPGTYVVGVTDVVWGIDFDAQPVTVALLEQMLALDAQRVDPSTGAAR